MAVTLVNSQPIFIFFTVIDSLINLQQSIYLICVATLPRETLMPENEQQSQTNAVILTTTY